MLARATIDDDKASARTLISSASDRTFETYLDLSEHRHWMPQHVVHRWLQPRDASAQFRWPLWAPPRVYRLRTWLERLPRAETKHVRQAVAARLPEQHPNDVGTLSNLACRHLATPGEWLSEVVQLSPQLSVVQFQVAVWACARVTRTTWAQELDMVLEGLQRLRAGLDHATMHHMAAAVHALSMANAVASNGQQRHLQDAWRVLLARLPPEDPQAQVALVAAFAACLSAEDRSKLQLAQTAPRSDAITQGLSFAAEPVDVLREWTGMATTPQQRRALAELLLLPLADAGHQGRFRAATLMRRESKASATDAAARFEAMAEMLLHHARTVPGSLHADPVLIGVHRALLGRLAQDGSAADAVGPLVELYASVRRIAPNDPAGRLRVLQADLAEYHRTAPDKALVERLQSFCSVLLGALDP